MADNPYINYEDLSNLVVPDTSNVLINVQQEWKNALGDSISVDASTPQGRMIEMETAARTGVIRLFAMMMNQININYAGGRFLDGLGSLFGISRNGATRTYVTCTVGGVANTVIPAGSSAKTTAGDLFFAQNSITIGSNGSATGIFVANVPGAVPCAVNTLTKITTNVVGWETINNTGAATIGSDVESDYDFRKRIKASRYSGVGIVEDVNSALSGVSGIGDFVVYNNPNGTAQTIDSSLTIPAHSVCVIAEAGTNADIADALYKTVSIGCGYTAISGNSVTVQKDYVVGGVTFNRPTAVPIDISISVKRNKYTGSDLTGDVKSAILNWANDEVDGVDGIHIKSTIYTYEIGAGVSDQMPEIIVADVKIALHGGTLSGSPITTLASQLATVSTENITVTEV